MIIGMGNDRRGSLIQDCQIVQRTGDPSLFTCNNPDGLMSVCLSGYAVVPLEDLLDDAVIEDLRQKAVEYVER